MTATGVHRGAGSERRATGQAARTIRFRPAARCSCTVCGPR